MKDFRHIIEEWHLRIWGGAFFFAAILWLFVISEQTYSYVIEVPIEVRNIKEGKTLRGEVDPTANVKFQATGRAFLWAFLWKSLSVRRSAFKLVLDLEQISTDYDFYLNNYYNRHREKVVIPATFELEFIEVVKPDSIHISLDDYMIKPVKVVLNVIIQPASQFIQVGSTRISDETIELRGPKEIILYVDTVETVYTEFLDLETTLNRSIPLNLTFPGVVEADPPTIEIEADIQEIGERIITEVPVKVLNTPKGIRVFPNPSTVSLTVTGGVDFIAGLESSDIEVFIDYKESRQRQQIYHKPTVNVPDDVLQWRDLSPKNIELAIARIRE